VVWHYFRVVLERGVQDCQIFLATTFQNGKKYSKKTERPNNIQNEHEIYQHLPLQDPPKFTQIWTFGLKMPENISGGV
jgi:hypothetical protein